MRNKELVKIYNDLLSKDLKSLEVKSFEDFKQKSISDLEKLFEFFSNQLSKKGVGSDGEVNEAGKIIDDIAGKINLEIIRKKSH